MNSVRKITNFLFGSTFFKFAIVGVVNTVVGTSIMLILYNFAGFGYWFSSAMNYFLTSILSFFLNKYFTFSVRHWDLKMIGGFIFTIAASYLLAYKIARFAVHQLLNRYDMKTRDNISMLAGMCIFVGLNYLGQRFIAFRINNGAKNDK
jgi:putative flippase GtrA